LNPDEVVLIGDNLDLPEFSTKFVVKPEFVRCTQPAIDYLSALIEEMCGLTNKVTMLEGNHDKRLVDYIIKNAAASYGIKRANMPEEAPVFSVSYLLGLAQMGVEYIGNYPKGSYWLNKKLCCTHGHKVGAAPGSSASKMLDGINYSVIFGHTHRVESAHTNIFTGGETETIGAYNVGCLARLDGVVPSNARNENWQNGACIVEYNDDCHQVYLPLIQNGVLRYHGQEYK